MSGGNNNYGIFFSKRSLIKSNEERNSIIQPLTHYFAGPQGEISMKYVDALRNQVPKFMEQVLMGSTNSVLAVCLSNQFIQPNILQNLAENFVAYYPEVYKILEDVLNKFKQEHIKDPNYTKLCNEAQKIFNGITKCFDNIINQFNKLSNEFKFQVPEVSVRSESLAVTSG